MDFLQEDVDSMQVFLKLLPLSLMILIHQRELDQWRKENRSLQLELRHEESLTAQVNCHFSLRLLLLTRWENCNIDEYFQTLQPLSSHLADLTAAVSEQVNTVQIYWCLILLLKAGQDIHGEVKHPEERREDWEDGVEHRTDPPVVGQLVQKTKVAAIEYKQVLEQIQSPFQCSSEIVNHFRNISDWYEWPR